MFSVTKLPDVMFFCQQVNLPGIMLGAPDFVNPLQIAPIPGDTLTYDTLNVQFLVDSELKNYKTIYNWIVALGFPETYDQYSAFIAADTNNYTELSKNYSDGTLSILSGKNNIVQQVQFIDLFPTSLESMIFQSTSTDVNYIVGNASFRYAYYKMI
jgi:hypothetical protein